MVYKLVKKRVNRSEILSKLVIFVKLVVNVKLVCALKHNESFAGLGFVD